MLWEKRYMGLLITKPEESEVNLLSQHSLLFTRTRRSRVHSKGFTTRCRFRHMPPKSWSSREHSSVSTFSPLLATSVWLLMNADWLCRQILGRETLSVHAVRAMCEGNQVFLLSSYFLYVWTDLRARNFGITINSVVSGLQSTPIVCLIWISREGLSP